MPLPCTNRLKVKIRSLGDEIALANTVLLIDDMVERLDLSFLNIVIPTADDHRGYHEQTPSYRPLYFTSIAFAAFS